MGNIFFREILVIKPDKALNKLIKGFDVPTEQVILQQFIWFFSNYSKKRLLSSYRDLSSRWCVYLIKCTQESILKKLQ